MRRRRRRRRRVTTVTTTTMATMATATSGCEPPSHGSPPSAVSGSSRSTPVGPQLRVISRFPAAPTWWCRWRRPRWRRPRRWWRRAVPWTPPASRRPRLGSGSPVVVVDRRRRRRSPSSLPLRIWPLPDPLQGALGLLIVIDAPDPVNERLMVLRHLEAFVGTMPLCGVLAACNLQLHGQLQDYVRLVKEQSPSVQRRRRRRRREGVEAAPQGGARAGPRHLDVSAGRA